MEFDISRQIKIMALENRFGLTTSKAIDALLEMDWNLELAVENIIARRDKGGLK